MNLHQTFVARLSVAFAGFGWAPWLSLILLLNLIGCGNYTSRAKPMRDPNDRFKQGGSFYLNHRYCMYHATSKHVLYALLFDVNFFPGAKHSLYSTVETTALFNDGRKFEMLSPDEEHFSINGVSYDTKLGQLFVIEGTPQGFNVRQVQPRLKSADNYLQGDEVKDYIKQRIQDASEQDPELQQFLAPPPNKKRRTN